MRQGRRRIFLLVSLCRCVDALQEQVSTRRKWIDLSGKRAAIATVVGLASNTLHPSAASCARIQQQPPSTKNLQLVNDPETYSALAYSPPRSDSSSLPPLILLLHGAGSNDKSPWDLANPNGEHAGLIPSLIASGRAPLEVQNCAILAPYSFNAPSFYSEPRSKLIRFLEWAKSPQGRAAGCPEFDPRRVAIFGFSDGATVAVELLTTKRFSAGIICSYGFTGTLPEAAVDRLANIPMWVFHSKDDVIFDVSNSDKLVKRLREKSESSDTIRYSRFDNDPENFPDRVRGHTMGITASKSPAVYQWIASLPPYPPATSM